ncbi:hypothetical protein [Tropicimonas sp. IMCC6043]|uniref:hypothetical protein n=1 Tax=Tropicimonas sp. IMCC6043 TaxID=2510645 RepID=UPI00101D206D|nr:hypothetical protein [Tropicimonas sp. IMCC6043]RYH09774.1 hypothetical protein EU800_11065 [Tropicimonas sp. IMCC6043]
MAQRRLRAELARLASTAPHLLADIGLEPEGRGGRAWSGAGYRVVRTPPAGESEVEILADAG